MPINSLRWRALALLGALLSVVVMWPFCCAARPLYTTSQTPTLNNSTNIITIATSDTTTVNYFLNRIVFNRTEVITDKNISNINKSEQNSTILSRSDRSAPGMNGTRRGRRRESDRNERSANLSHITGANRKIQLYIKNRFLQILPDGSINGTHDDTSDYSK